MNKEIRCTAPGRFHQYQRLICGVTGTNAKITQKMTGARPPKGGWTPQPMHLCAKHWSNYQEVSAVSGDAQSPQRRWPG
jgi:hypothetical protein